MIQVYQGQRKDKGKRFHEINEEKNDSMDDLADQVQSLFYHDVHFNSINTRMHTAIECRAPDGKTLVGKLLKLTLVADGKPNAHVNVYEIVPKN